MALLLPIVSDPALPPARMTGGGLEAVAPVRATHARRGTTSSFVSQLLPARARRVRRERDAPAGRPPLPASRLHTSGDQLTGRGLAPPHTLGRSAAYLERSRTGRACLRSHPLDPTLALTLAPTLALTPALNLTSLAPLPLTIPSNRWRSTARSSRLLRRRLHGAAHFRTTR